MSDEQLAKIERWYTDHPDDGVVEACREIRRLRRRVAELERTLEILNNPSGVGALLRKSQSDIESGRLHSHEEIKNELG